MHAAFSVITRIAITSLVHKLVVSNSVQCSCRNIHKSSPVAVRLECHGRCGELREEIRSHDDIARTESCTEDIVEIYAL